MKKNLSTLAIGLFLFSCKKEESKDCFKIKFVDGICASNIFQIQDTAFFYLAPDSYTSIKDGKVYTNVFTLQNYCEPFNGNADGTITVSLKTKNYSNSCITCLAIYPGTPPKQLAVEECK